MPRKERRIKEDVKKFKTLANATGQLSLQLAFKNHHQPVNNKNASNDVHNCPEPISTQYNQAPQISSHDDDSDTDT